ncbi:MAG: hypothetical protein JO359_02405 [Candidatus Eremiobacteraeota bacterium]|nr:hypothetical protein [Candidatus Eremiobacteraeota bacterium]
MIGWDAIAAIGSIGNAAVVLVGGAIALYQLGETRRAAQFDATQRMIDRLLARDFNRAVLFVINELPNKMRDAEYASELATSRGWDVDPELHPELFVLVRLEETGIYLRRRLILADALLDFDAILILQSWEHLRAVVDLMRKSHRNPHVWSNAEFLYNRARSARRLPPHA